MPDKHRVTNIINADSILLEVIFNPKNLGGGPSGGILYSLS